MQPSVDTREAIVECGRALTQGLGARVRCLAVYGSAASDEWSPDHSDVNLVLVLERVEHADLKLIGEILARRARSQPAMRLAAPLVLTPDFLDRARDVFAIELADLRDRHRLLAGEDLLAGLRIEPHALRAQAERETRGKLLRLRALAIAMPERASAIAALASAATTFRVLGRHLSREAGPAGGRGLHVVAEPSPPADAGSLLSSPALRRLEDHRAGRHPWPDDDGLADLVGALLEEVEHVVAQLDARGR